MHFIIWTFLGEGKTLCRIWFYIFYGLFHSLKKQKYVDDYDHEEEEDSDDDNDDDVRLMIMRRRWRIKR